MMFGDVPISVIVPPSSEPNAIGISSIDGERFERLAICSAIGIIIASAPMFFTNADSSATAPTSTRICTRGEADVRRNRLQRQLDDARARDGRADDQRARDDDDDLVAEAAERLVRGHDADQHRDQQRHAGHQVVAQPAPHEQRHRAGNDCEGQDLLQRHR